MAAAPHRLEGRLDQTQAIRRVPVAFGDSEWSDTSAAVFLPGGTYSEQRGDRLSAGLEAIRPMLSITKDEPESPANQPKSELKSLREFMRRAIIMAIRAEKRRLREINSFRWKLKCCSEYGPASQDTDESQMNAAYLYS